MEHVTALRLCGELRGTLESISEGMGTLLTVGSDRCQAVNCRKAATRSRVVQLHGLISLEVRVRVCEFHAEHLRAHSESR